MELKNIYEIAQTAGIDEKFVEPYGKVKAKIDTKIMKEIGNNPDGKVVLVTAITPTKAGEGKTTTSIALAEGLGKINRKALLVLREPSLGPVFGIKGGATGGGKATIEPAEDINLHFTGDMHALTSSINLIAAIIDNSIYRGNPLSIDASRVTWKRALDMNDRTLRSVTIGQGHGNGVEREENFVITVASELMAIMCLAENEQDFMDRVNKIIVAYTYLDKPVRILDLRISHAIMKLMRDALKPNLVQTIEGNPCIIHGGPFANIAHGCNSVIATKMAMKLAPIVITEAGFAADLGAEKFFDIKCRSAGITPSLVIMVATIRALKLHGGKPLDKIEEEDVKLMMKGTANLYQHIENVRKFGLPVLVTINHFASDTKAEIDALTQWCKDVQIPVVFNDGFARGGAGAVEMANKVVEMLDAQENLPNFKYLYDVEEPLEKKIETICKQIYRANNVVFTKDCKEKMEELKRLGPGFVNLPVCMAKTPQSFTDDPNVLGAPRGFNITVRDVSLSAGAGFVVAYTGEIMTMPGLPAVPAAVKMEDKDY